jgi:hypothetical protein
MTVGPVDRFLFVAALLAAAVPGAPAAAESALASYRAVYDLTLDDTAKDSAESTVGDLTGRLVTELQGSRCAGYKAKVRFVTEMQNEDGDNEVTDSRSTSFESGDGSQFTFDNQTYSNQNLVEESAGKANRAGDAVGVNLTKPGKKHLSFSAGTLFPTSQMTHVLEAARNGQSFVSFDVYDGSEAGETLFATAAVIGPASVASDDVGDETAVSDAGISKLRHWPVTVSYFDKATRGDGTPFYVMSFVLYDNGIGRKLRIDYGDFAVIGHLSRLEMLPSAACP